MGPGLLGDAFSNQDSKWLGHSMGRRKIWPWTMVGWMDGWMVGARKRGQKEVTAKDHRVNDIQGYCVQFIAVFLYLL